MTGRNTFTQAAHYRELAYWTSDERTHRILLEMARELEERDDDGLPRPCESKVRSLPRSLS